MKTMTGKANGFGSLYQWKNIVTVRQKWRLNGDDVQNGGMNFPILTVICKPNIEIGVSVASLQYMR